jgi:hypothetical protein
MMDDKEKLMMTNMAQAVADLSAMMMPMSGLTMMGLMMQAKAVAMHLELPDFKPSDSAFEGTVKMVAIIRKPMEEQYDKLKKELEELKAKIKVK